MTMTADGEARRLAGLRRGGANSARLSRRRAAEADAHLLPLVKHLRKRGLSLQEIADALNDEGYATRTGSDWTRMQVHRMLSRANAVKQMLQLLGARADQIEAVSFGEEKPRCTQQAESCWSQNRRGDIAYQGE